MEGFFDLGPPPPSRPKIVFFIHPAELKLTLKGSEVVSLVPRDSGEGTLEFTCVRACVRGHDFSAPTEPFGPKIGM